MEIARAAGSSSTSATPLSLHISVYVTCLCNPEAVPPIPNCDVTIMRPDVHHILNDLLTPPTSSSSSLSQASASPMTGVLYREKLSASSSTSSVKENGISSPITAPPPLPPQKIDSDDQEIVLVSKPGHVTTAHGQDDADIESTDGLDPRASRKLPWLGAGGGVAVCASGPASLVREAANAVARLRLSSRGMEMGGVDIHTEVFSL